jgi:hypothetical protein
LAVGIALLGSLSSPLKRLLVILWQTTAATLVHEAEVGLAEGIALLGRFPEPLNRLLIILCQTTAAN